MLICAHWYQVNCSRSEQHYDANLLIGQRDKPFVNDDPVFFSKEKELKTLHNPDTLQNLGQSPTSRESKARQPKSQVNNENIQVNRVFQTNLKRDGESSIAFPGKSTSFTSAFSTTEPSVSNRRAAEDLSSLPLAGSVLPGGFRSFPFSNPVKQQNQGFTFNTPAVRSTSGPLPHRNTPAVQFVSSATLQPESAAHTVSFAPSTTPNSINTINNLNFFGTTKSPASFTSKHFSIATNKVQQPSGFTKSTFSPSFFVHDTSTSEPNFSFLPPSNPKPSIDLAVASQENAITSRRSTTTTTPPTFEMFGESIPETDVKAEIEQPKNGSLPTDRFNTFIKRFNPFEQPPAPTTEAAETHKPEPEVHTFINRFVPDIEPPAPVNNLEQHHETVFVNRFVLTPEEQKFDKDRHQVDKLHDLQPPDDHLRVSFPNFDLSPPYEDSDDSESNKIELHLQDPRRTFFIPSDEDENDFSKADAAPIIVTIPLHSPQKSPPMWFRTNESADACSKCHPSFIVNKDTCMPCVIIR